MSRATFAGDKLSRMAESDEKADLLRYLQIARESLVWKLDGLSEYDVRRPMVPTGTNLLGLIKHTGSVELGYFGNSFGRPFPEPLQWLADDAGPDDDMWAKSDETRDDIVDFYKRAWAHADETINANPLDAIANRAVVAGGPSPDDTASPARARHRRDESPRRATPTSCAN